MDLVELEKAKRFYQSHKKRLHTVLNGEEVSYVRKSKRPYEKLAILLAAKEAVFKALSLPWMGIAGFQDIQIFPRGSHRLAFQLKGDFVRLKISAENLELSLIKKNPDYVVLHYLYHF